MDQLYRKNMTLKLLFVGELSGTLPVSLAPNEKLQQTSLRSPTTSIPVLFFPHQVGFNQLFEGGNKENSAL